VSFFAVEYLKIIIFIYAEYVKKNRPVGKWRELDVNEKFAEAKKN
jgi:hypothetical protein